MKQKKISIEQRILDTNLENNCLPQFYAIFIRGCPVALSEVGEHLLTTNRRDHRSCLGWVFNLKLGSFTDNTKIVQYAMATSEVENSA
jgi:hypothetical protein